MTTSHSKCSALGCKRSAVDGGWCQHHLDELDQVHRAGGSVAARERALAEGLTPRQEYWLCRIEDYTAASEEGWRCYAHVRGMADRLKWKARAEAADDALTTAKLAFSCDLPEGGVVNVLGLDPGSRQFGWAVVECCADQFRVVKAGTISARGLATRWGHIYSEILTLLRYYPIGMASVETPFVNRKFRLDTAITLAQARGCALAALNTAGVPDIIDIEPTSAKKLATGNGKADKDLMAKAAFELTGYPVGPGDEADAICIAIAGYRQWLEGERGTK